MSRGSLISPLVSELLAQVAKGDRITEEHVKRFLENPDRVMPETVLKVEETFVSLLPKDRVEGNSEPVFDEGDLVSVVREDGGRWVAKNGVKIHGPHERVYGDEPCDADIGLRSAGGVSVVAAKTAAGGWSMVRFSKEGVETFPLPGPPRAQPSIVSGVPTCVARGVYGVDESFASYVVHGPEVHGPYASVEPSSLCGTRGKIAYVAREHGVEKESVFLSGEPLVFRDGYRADAREHKGWGRITDLVCDDLAHTTDPCRMSFVAFDQGYCQIFHRGRPLPLCWSSCKGMAVDLVEKSKTRDRIVYAVPHDSAFAVLDANGSVVSAGWDDIWDLRFGNGAVSFIGKRRERVSVVVVVLCPDNDAWWQEQIYGHYDMVWEPKIVLKTPVFVAKKDNQRFVVDGTRESKIRVAKRESVLWHGLANGTILQIVRDEEQGTDTMHFGERKSRQFDRIYGLRHLDHARIEFMALKNRRLVRAWFYFI